MVQSDTTITESNHHGRWIQLKSGQRPNGLWECVYTILEIGPTRSSSVKRKIAGIFLTREEAEAAAEDEAQVEIDSRGPLS